ncbi:MAG: hypothetical protein LBV16_02810 [Elusimicrobiota bacterium]|jgi:hypothetical protein|nr:hypothetical protein [Elusimicrobiota bacterium]
MAMSNVRKANGDAMKEFKKQLNTAQRCEICNQCMISKDALQTFNKK